MKPTSLILCLALLAAAPTPAQAQPAPLIDGAALLADPPPPGSAMQMGERTLEGIAVSPERLAQASQDQTIDPFLNFGPAFGPGFERARLRRTAELLDAVRAAAGPVIGAAKARFHRDRPYVGEAQLARCTPAPTPELGPYVSYPSGHATLGWAFALALAEIAPARADAILRRGYEYGESRIICGVHWPSDVAAGRLIAAGLIARLHGEDSFRTLMGSARRELANAMR